MKVSVKKTKTKQKKEKDKMTLEKTKGQVAAGGSKAGSAFKEAPPPHSTISSNHPECEQPTQPVDNPSKSSGRKKKEREREKSTEWRRSLK